MALQKEDIEQIKAVVKENLHEWLAEESLGRPPLVYEIELRDRIIRVEEELKHQRELMGQGFTMMDKRFDGQREDTNKCFEMIDKRFEMIDKRFEMIDKRFEELREDMNKRFEIVERQITRITWFVSTGFVFIGLLVTILKFFK